MTNRAESGNYAKYEGWILGPGGQAVDGPSVAENTVVVPKARLDAAEETLREIARGRLENPIQFARGYFKGRTIVEKRTIS